MSLKLFYTTFHQEPKGFLKVTEEDELKVYLKSGNVKHLTLCYDTNSIKILKWIKEQVFHGKIQFNFTCNWKPEEKSGFEPTIFEQTLQVMKDFVDNIQDEVSIYLDDSRPTPEGCIRTYTVEDTILWLKTGRVWHLSLDHDLGFHNSNGYDVMLWMEEQVLNNGFTPPERVKFHTDNVVGRENMKASMRKIRTFLMENDNVQQD